MRAMIEGRQAPTPDAIAPLDRCLGCRACETACPSGVRYGALLEGMRAAITEPRRPWGLRRWFWRPIIRKVLPSRRRLAWLVAPLRLLALGDRQWLPPVVRRSVDALPHAPRPPELPDFVPAHGPRRGTAGFLAGCAMPVLFAHVNEASVRLLASAGWDVVIPRQAGCCGALQAHDGDARGAHEAHEATRAAFAGCDIVVTNSAGCGAAMKDHGGMAVRDLSEALLEADWRPSRPLPATRVAYHDPCHLRHGQGITSEPRDLLVRAGLTLVEAPEPDMCCGGAGSYTLLQPDLSAALMARKVRNLLVPGPELLVTANPSCLMQIQAGLADHGAKLPVAHLAEVLAQTLVST